MLEAMAGLNHPLSEPSMNVDQHTAKKTIFGCEQNFVLSFLEYCPSGFSSSRDGQLTCAGKDGES